MMKPALTLDGIKRPAVWEYVPASLTLVERHDGRACAMDDARSARLGALALAGFAAVVTSAAEAWPPMLSLTAATAAWLGIATALWIFICARH